MVLLTGGRVTLRSLSSPGGAVSCIKKPLDYTDNHTFKALCRMERSNADRMNYPWPVM
jgi:hypothetical protein